MRILIGTKDLGSVSDTGTWTTLSPTRYTPRHNLEVRKWDGLAFEVGWRNTSTNAD